MEWRQIPGFPAYEISDTGIVKRVARPFPRLLCSFPRIITPQYTGKKPHQQQSVLIHDVSGRPWTKIVLALVAVAFLGPRPSLQHCVNYKDGDRDNRAVEISIGVLALSFLTSDTAARLRPRTYLPSVGDTPASAVSWARWRKRSAPRRKTFS